MMWSYVNGQDFAVTDSSFYDPDFPPEHFPMHFMSAGAPVQAFMWVAQGKEAKGCAIFVPQLHGGDNLESLITPLIASGIHAMKIHPRGMWDSDHDYTHDKAIEDIHSAVAWLRQNDGEHHGHTYRQRTYWIDPDRIAIIGKSGGGGLNGCAAAAENPHLNSVVAVAPPNIEVSRGILEIAKGGQLSDEVRAIFEHSAHIKDATAGRVDVRAVMESLTAADFDKLSMIKQAPNLVDKNLLLVGASADRHEHELNHRPIAAALRAAGAKHFSEVVLEADAYFLTARIALARLVISWLHEVCGF